MADTSMFPWRALQLCIDRITPRCIELIQGLHDRAHQGQCWPLNWWRDRDSCKLLLKSKKEVNGKAEHYLTVEQQELFTMRLVTEAGLFRWLMVVQTVVLRYLV